MSKTLLEENDRLKTDMAELKQQNQRRGKMTQAGALEHGVVLKVSKFITTTTHTHNEPLATLTQKTVVIAEVIPHLGVRQSSLGLLSMQVNGDY